MISERRFYDGYDHKVDSSTPTQALLLHPLMLHDNYPCLVESNMQQIEEGRSKIQAENSEKRAAPEASLDSSYAQRLCRFLVTGG